MLILIHNKPQIVSPTMFPDRTSQVWHLEFTPGTAAEIWWRFDHEGELMHLAQLIALLRTEGIKINRIVIPFLPYARQDKVVSNNATFAFNTFAQMLGFITDGIPVKALDIHGYPYFIENIQPTEFILKTLLRSKADVIVFPDAGAKRRYAPLLDMMPHITLEKTRDQGTGEITGLKFVEETIPPFEHALIVDDLIDGGRTFIETTKLLKSTRDKPVSLYASHAIFSKGINILLEGGIDTIYTTNSFFNNQKSEKLVTYLTENL